MDVLPDIVPPKPGLVREPDFAGPRIEIETWSLPVAAFGRFVERIPAPLGIGKSGSTTVDRSGFPCEASATIGALEITALGGWRSYTAKPALA